MPRRVTLPGAAELFRPTQSAPLDPAAPESGLESTGLESMVPKLVPVPDSNGRTRGSGRVKHEEKFTVYVSSDELLALERARLLLRAEHQMAVDRGRIVREALALALEDLDERGADSELVRRLQSS